MAAFDFPTSSSPGARPGEGAGRLINAYAFKDGVSAVYGPAPGLLRFAEIGPGMRGALLVGSTLYAAVQDTLVRVSASGVVEAIGQLAGERRVTMARNNRSPTPDTVIVTENGAYLTDGASVTEYPDQDVGNPVSVAFLDGYFVFAYGDGTIRASEINSTDLNAESFTKAEAKPDGLLTGVRKGRQFFAFGPFSAEIYDNAGTAPFPLSRSEVVDVGLFGPHAVAGYEDGWDRQLFTVASDETVRRWDGYSPVIVSTRDVERAIAGVTDRTALTACCYVFGGSSVVSLSGPGFTWEYHTGIGQWFERRSYGMERWRGGVTVNAFDRWLVGEVSGSRLLAISEATRREADDPLVCRIEGMIESFPAGGRLDNLRIDVSTGQGRETGIDPIETDPSVMVSWSLDGGAGWGTPLQRRLGRQGDYDAMVSVSSLGRAKHKGVRLRLEVSDPVPFALRGADIGRVAGRKF